MLDGRRKMLDDVKEKCSILIYRTSNIQRLKSTIYHASPWMIQGEVARRAGGDKDKEFHRNHIYIYGQSSQDKQINK